MKNDSIEIDNKDDQELLNLVKGYLATYVDKILGEEGASGIIASLLKEYSKDVHELKEQIEKLKQQIEDLKTTTTTLMTLINTGTGDNNKYNPWGWSSDHLYNGLYDGIRDTVSDANASNIK